MSQLQKDLNTVEKSLEAFTEKDRYVETSLLVLYIYPLYLSISIITNIQYWSSSILVLIRFVEVMSSFVAKAREDVVQIDQNFKIMNEKFGQVNSIKIRRKIYIESKSNQKR